MLLKNKCEHSKAHKIHQSIKQNLVLTQIHCEHFHQLLPKKYKPALDLKKKKTLYP
jgi:hypothetical protein